MTEENNQTPEQSEKNQPESIDVAASITIGQLLKTKREERGLTLKTISQQTKIHMGLLEFLENDDLAKLPSKAYVRGFVKSAAKILGIDQVVALNVMEATYNRAHKPGVKEVRNYEMSTETARNTLSSITTTPLETVKSVTASSAGFLAKMAVGILIFGVIGFNIKNLIDRSAEEKLKLPQVLSTIHQKAKPAPKPEAEKTETKELAPGSTLTDPLQVNIIEDKKDANLKTEMTVKDVSLKSISLGEKQFTEDNSITGAALDEIFPPRYRVQVVKGVETLYINAVDGDTWLTHKVDDKDIKKYVLRQGRSVFLRGGLIRLFLGNANAVKIFYNNKLINLNSKTGVKNLVVPEEMKTKYMAPLFVFQKDGSVVTSDEFLKSNQETPAAPAAPATTTPAAR